MPSNLKLLTQKKWWRLFGLLIGTFLTLAACTVSLPETVQVDLPVTADVSVDGATTSIESDAGTVRQLLEEGEIELGELDLVDPPLYTPAEDGMQIVITRVEESLETIERAIPFERRIVRNEAMSASDDPVIIQEGGNGLEELTVQIVYRDGIEVERRVIQSAIVTESQEEIVMIGLDITASADVVRFGGVLAFVNGGRIQLFRGSNLFPEDLPIEGVLDRRVFSLSPDGRYLLYTTIDEADPTRFNRLYLSETADTKRAVELDINNVLWADWNPMEADPLQIAYSTGEATATAPGWEANNDLWSVNISGTVVISDSLRPLVEGYPATFGWWGGNYAWSPTGREIGYSFADEVGVLQIVPDEDETTSPIFAESDGEGDVGEEQDEEQDDEENLETTGAENDLPDGEGPGVVRRQLATFTEFDTRSDWVWVPPLSWSADGRYLTFTGHRGDQTTADAFNTQMIDTRSGLSGPLIDDVGIWSAPLWSAAVIEPNGADPQIAFLRATNTRESLGSSYTLWLMDRDGSNKRELFPPPGITSRFPRDSRFMVWNSGSGGDMIFVFDGDLYWYDLKGERVSQLTNDEPEAALPTWAPYGFAAASAQE